MEGLQSNHLQAIPDPQTIPYQHPQLESLEVKTLPIKHPELNSTCPLTQRTHQEYLTHRTLVRLYLKAPLIEQCLESFDIFKDIFEDPLQKNKLVRDVMRNLKLEAVEEGTALYSKGDPAESIFMVLKGTVSLCLPVAREDCFETNNTVQYDFRQIDCFEAGQGFGEAEFIQGSKRGLCALGKENGTVLGVLGFSAFSEVVEMYRQRVYFGKLEMFGRCPLLRSLKPYQLQFIVNNAKPVHFPISHAIVNEQEQPKALYLITHGQVELRKTNYSSGMQLRRLKKRAFYSVEEETSLESKKTVVGILEEGGFLGDAQLALGLPYSFQAVCLSEKVKAYACNLKIIESQLGEDLSTTTRNHYQDKQEHRQCQMRCYTEAKSQVKRQLQNLSAVVLTSSQLKMKRQILNRYADQQPNLVNKLSPIQISKSIQRKYARIAHQTPLQAPRLPFVRRVPLVKNPRTLSPILKKRRHSTKEERRNSTKKELLMKPVKEEQKELSVVEMRHLYEFIGKLRSQLQNRV